MGERFHDRLSGKDAHQAEAQQTIVGRWLVTPQVGEPIFMNSVPVCNGEFLVPDASGNWRLVGHDGFMAQGTVARSLQPEDIEAHSLRTIGAHLEELSTVSGGWLQWLDVVPVVPGISETAGLLPFERMIREEFGHLEAVCLKPRAHLHVEVERVSVDRARRLPVRAASYLASHTEDWERPLIRGVRPKRILSEVRQDQIDIYENRVAARLVDHILVYLVHRIRVLRKLLKVFQDKEDYSRAVAGTYLRQRRILRLWGQSIDSNEGRPRAESTLKELDRLKHRVMGLMDSPLYREVPRRTYVAPTLRTTNILTNDQDYRRVADLWRKWAGSGEADTKSPADVYRDAQELCRGMDHFALLLVLRALDQLGYLPCERDLEKPIRASQRWDLEGHGTHIGFVWDEGGRIQIEAGGQRLTFIALPMNFGGANNDSQLQDTISRAIGAIEEASERVVIIHSRSSDDSEMSISLEAQCRLQSVGNDPRTGLPPCCGFVPVSPWDIGSVERVARALRWFLDSARFDSYPLVVKVARGACDVWASADRSDWLDVSTDGSQLVLRRTPKDFEWERLAVDRLVANAREDYQKAVGDHERLSDDLREAVRSRTAGTLNQQKKQAYQKCVESKERLEAIERTHLDLADARDRSAALLVCPACGTTADPGRDFKARDKGCFRCDCEGCRTQWATRMCSNGHRYAVMLPGNFVDTEDASPGWEDRAYGSDLLALPTRTVNGNWGFVCPSCGEAR